MSSMINRFFSNIFHLDGVIHWLVQRSTAVMTLFCLVFVFTSDNLAIFCILGSLLIIHISAGIQTLIDDYIHDNILFLISVTYLRISILFVFKILCVICVC